jgi:hypothetical protein
MSEEKRSRLNFSKCQDYTAKVHCVNKSTVSHVCREAKKGKEEGTNLFLSPRRHINIPNRATSLDNFQKDVYV